MRVRACLSVGLPARRGVELGALLQYVANQLKSTESLDLLVLRDILATMTVRGMHSVRSMP